MEVDDDRAARGDLFFDALVEGYVDHERFLRRDWLADEVALRLEQPDCRFLLLTAEPGAGKSTFIAQLARDHHWPAYFIRRDQRTPLGDVGGHSFLLHLGYQLAALYPELFTPEHVRIIVEQRIGSVEKEGEAIGAEADRILASPFYQRVVQVRQEVERNQGRVTGLRVGEWVVDPRLLPLQDLQFMALFDPAEVLLKRDPAARLVILVDALDELRYHGGQHTLLSWLTHAPALPDNVRLVLTACPPAPGGSIDLFCRKQAPFLDRLELDLGDDNMLRDVQIYVSNLVERKEVAAALKKGSRKRMGPGLERRRIGSAAGTRKRRTRRRFHREYKKDLA